MRQIAKKYLSQFGKSQEVDDRLSAMIQAEQCRTPLYLKLALDELRLEAIHDTLVPH